MYKIKLAEYPRMKRWMRGTVVKEMPLKNIITTPWQQELEEIIHTWFKEYFTVTSKKVNINMIRSISSNETELRVQSFLHSMKLYDIRIIHLRNHKMLDQSLIKLKISFKRPSKKYYESMKLLTRITCG